MAPAYWYVLAGWLALIYQAPGAQRALPAPWSPYFWEPLYCFGVARANSFPAHFPGLKWATNPLILIWMYRNRSGLGIGAIFIATLKPNSPGQIDYNPHVCSKMVHSRASYAERAPVMGFRATLFSAIYQASIVVLPCFTSHNNCFDAHPADNKQLSGSMRLPILIGLNICFLQILLTSLFRYLLTGTWAPLDL